MTSSRRGAPAGGVLAALAAPALALVAALALGACSSDTPPPKVGKGIGEQCRVSAECAANLRCANDVCAPGTCSMATECTGEAPEGCVGWSCIGGICEPDCPHPDASVVPMDASAPTDAGVVFLDATARDADPVDATAADASGADATALDAAEVPDTGAIDAGQPSADTGVADAQPALDAGVPPDAEPLDSGAAGPDTGVVADAGVRPDATAADATAPDASATPDAGSTCTQAARAPAAGDLVINEILAAPSAVDVNGDGTASSTQDEFVEIGNVSSAPLLLENVVLADSVSVRHTFAPYTLDCGKVIVVWGGGNPAAMGWRSNWVIASSGTVALNNTGDTVRLGTSTATPGDLATYTYGSEANRSESVVRDPDLTGASLVRHSLASSSAGALYSPGVRANGSEF